MKDLIIHILKKHSPYPMTSAQIIGEVSKYGKNLYPSELRKIINELRRDGIEPILANTKGYFISADKEEILTEIASLRKRAMKILSAAQGLKSFIKSNQLKLFTEEIC